MPETTIVAHVFAKTDHVDHVKSELEKLIPLTRNEPGCLQYELHRDRADPSHFLFYERWESPAHLQVHMKSDHVKAYLQAAEGAVREVLLYETDGIH